MAQYDKKIEYDEQSGWWECLLNGEVIGMEPTPTEAWKYFDLYIYHAIDHPDGDEE
jgi:hypothetical protein